MGRASGTPKRQKRQTAVEDVERGDAYERISGWHSISELRWRPATGQHVIFLSDWLRAADAHGQNEQQEESSDRQEEDEASQAAKARPVEELLPPIEILKIVAARWVHLLEDDADKRSAVVSFRAPGVVSPAELTRWLPGAAARLYTLGGLVAPLSDSALSRMPLARYSVVRAPNMSFWPHLRALIEQQEREAPGMGLWEDLESDLALLEQELAWWIASPLGLILNLYEGETLVGHLSLARQHDAAEGCDGWGVIAFHIAPQARGQRLGTILQRVAATLLVTHKATRRIEPSAQPETTRASSETVQMAAVNTRQWPFLFGFIAANNIPALRAAYGAGRRIIGTYVDVPVAALQLPGLADQPEDLAEG
ncbi:MAG TPA: GNAT family N-acetyltransferase [Ktedonobacterales bacterium]|nr:GNAT family N-acetyltransferase [Ktedonobacterales bacterium]